MAKSKYEYVKQFELDDRLLPDCWLVVRLDGKAFHRFSTEHGFVKPNDDRSLRLMNRTAVALFDDDTFTDISIAYGNSDEYSFVFRRQTSVYNRRAMKIVTNLCSAFTANYVFHWKDFFPDVCIKYPPTFDGRIVLYPTDQSLRDYLSWRQADCHINNLYNTVFWALVDRGGLSRMDAERRLCGTVAGDKNEILYSQFGINYNNESAMHRKGTVIFRSGTKLSNDDATSKKKSKKSTSKLITGTQIEECNEDIIGDQFWTLHPNILEN